MPQLSLFFFGPPRAARADREIEIGLSKGRALLAYLMLTAKPHSREHLATLFWPESDEKRARGNLRRTLYRLNKALGDEFLVSGDTVCRNPEAAIWSDVEAFRELAKEGLEIDGETAGPTLSEAADLYADHFLAGFTLPDCPAFDEWQFFQREELRRVLARVLVASITIYEQEQEWDPAISAGRRWLALDSLHEPAHRTLMRLYARAGRQAAALRQYEQCVEHLAAELDVEPAEKTVALFEEIRSRRLEPATVALAPPAPAGKEARAEKQPGNGRPRTANLPTPLTSFVGREAELADIVTLLDRPACRLLTLLGAGGAGKTRLAAQTAQMVAGRFPDGVTWVDLQAVETAELLPTAIADALSLPGRDNPGQQVARFLQDKQMLLVLDNFEQLLDGAPFLTGLLQGAGGIRLLVTSRVALNLQEEGLYPLQGLPYPHLPEKGKSTGPSPGHGAEDAAVRLLVERVRRVRPDFSAEAEWADLVRICQLVDGMPLALELAASWARVMDCATIAGEIEQNLAFLVSTLRNVPARHRSMEAVFAHSWSLLRPEEQAIFRQLAVFRAGFRREAAEMVTGATLPILTVLVDRSLLRWEASGRYRMHALLRQYAVNQLQQAPAAREEAGQRHALYYADFLSERNESIAGGRQREAADEIMADLENIRAAWQWAVQAQRVALLGRMIEPLAMFFHFKGRYPEAAPLYAEALAMLEKLQPAGGAGADVEEVKALVLSETGWIDIRLGHFEKAERAFSTCQAIYEQLATPPLPGFGTDPLLGLGTLASIRGDYETAERLAQRALAGSRRHAHRDNHLNAAYQLAGIAYARGEYEAAQAHAENACRSAEEMGNDWFLAYCLNELGRAARAQGNYTTARRHFQASYALREAMADPEGMALALANLGEVALRQQRAEEAGRFYQRSVTHYREIDDRGGLALARHGLGKTALCQGDYGTAQPQLQEALQISAEIGFTTLLLAVLASAGELLLHTGRVQSGLGLLATVQAHPAADHETRTLLQAQWRHYHETLSPAQTEAAAVLGERPLTEAIALALAELAAPLPAPGASAALPAPAPPGPPAEPLMEPLTERELEVVQLLAQGLTNPQIAEELSVVVGTVKAHTNRIYGKLGVGNRVQAARRARELGLLS